MSLTRTLVFKPFRRVCNIVRDSWRNLFFTSWKVQRGIQFGKRGSWYVITSETHWISMHNRNMYIYIHTHTQTCLYMWIPKTTFYQSWKEPDLCVHTDVFCSDHAILGFPLLRVPCQCSLLPSDLNNWFRASFLFILSCLLCLFWLKSKDWRKKKKMMTAVCFLRAKVTMACQSSGIKTVCISLDAYCLRGAECVHKCWSRMCLFT